VASTTGRRRRATERFRIIDGAPEPDSAVAGEAGGAARGVAAAEAAAAGVDGLENLTSYAKEGQ